MITAEALHALNVEMASSKQTLTFMSPGVILGILALSVLASVVFNKDELPHLLPENLLGGNSAQ